MSENHKNKLVGLRRMRDAGLHTLAYSLTLDPTEEVRGAIDAVANKPGDELSLDKLVAETSNDTIEAKLDDVPVRVNENTASYRTDAVELPENYQDSPYDSSQDESEISYSAPSIDWNDAEAVYEAELDQRAFCDRFKIPQAKPVYHSAEVAERAEIHKIEKGYSMQFLEYDLKNDIKPVITIK